MARIALQTLLYGTAAFGIAAAIENVVLFLVAVSVIPATNGFLNPAYGGLTGGVAGPALLVLGNIGVTVIGGLVFGWLRVWPKSLIAPVMAHTSVDLSLTVAWFTVHHGSL